MAIRFVTLLVCKPEKAKEITETLQARAKMQNYPVKDELSASTNSLLSTVCSGLH